MHAAVKYSFLVEILWLMSFCQPLSVEKSGVAIVPFLAGYSGFPVQSRMFSALTRHVVGRCMH